MCFNHSRFYSVLFLFQLKPYVTYNLKEVIVQSEFTAQDLFDSTYGDEVVQQYQKNKLDVDKAAPEELLEKSSFAPKT